MKPHRLFAFRKFLSEYTYILTQNKRTEQINCWKWMKGQKQKGKHTWQFSRMENNICQGVTITKSLTFSNCQSTHKFGYFTLSRDRQQQGKRNKTQYTLKEHQMTLTFAIFQKFLITMVVYENFFFTPENYLKHFT